MKLKLRLIPVLLIGVALMYTACKKLNDGSPQTLPAKTVSSQVALNLSQVLYGGFGAFDISGGLNAPAGLGVTRQKLALRLNKGRKINDLGGDITCGMSVDTSLNYTEAIDATSQATIAGSIKFTFLCTNGVPSGFNVTDNFNVGETTPQVAATYNLTENLILQTLNPNDENANISFSGTFGLSDNIANKTGSKQTTTETYNYTFTSVLLSPVDAGIISGSATFSTKGNNASGTWNCSGTIVFLGNNLAKITINGTAYTVNLQTGTVS
ncbi:MAG: hypothetical protein JWP37_816 [Mucilaginibacter sp.]|nr:hypothetical protein [Mucilaginibacter sp.]